MIANHEVVAAHGFESIAVVETPGTVIVDEHGAVEMSEGVAKDGVEQPVEGCGVCADGVPVGDRHAKPAGAGQSGEWMASTLNSWPIWLGEVRRSSAVWTSPARSGLARASACA